MYELARGPLMYVATLVFLGGVAWRVSQFWRLTSRKPRQVWPTRGVRAATPEERRLRAIVAVQNSFVGQHPVMAVITSLFHSCVLLVPLLTLAHNLLLRESWGFALFSLPDSVIHVLTLVVLAGAVFFLVRRLILPHVRAISSLQDYLVLLMSAAPFLTGLLAYHQWFDYRTVLTLHMLSGELLLVAFPFTKLTHMIFFLLGRIFLAGEFALARGYRTWSP